MVINSSLKVIKDTYGTSEGKTVITEAVIKCMKEAAGGSNYDSEYGYIEITTPIIENVPAEQAAGNGKPSDKEKRQDVVKGVMLTSVSTDSINTTLDILSRRALLLEIMMMIAIFAIQVVDDLILPFYLLRNIHHKLPVKLRRRILLRQQGICQHFHGSNGRLHRSPEKGILSWYLKAKGR